MNDQPTKLPTGIALMLKSFGLNADEIMKSVATFAQIMAAIDGKLSTIIDQNSRILAKLEQDENGRTKPEQPGNPDTAG